MKNSLEGKKQSWDGMFYSIQRIDLLIISICGAGIYVCLETIKHLSANKDFCTCTCFIKISAGMFLVGIILNFLSQQYGYKANYESYLMYDCEVEVDEIKSLETITKEKKELLLKLDCDSKDYDKRSDRFSNLTTNLNYFSMGFMFLGLIFTFIFFVITF
ncbi:hypothetical protein [Flavobacterium sp. TAB 87]|uniref:hypothetical protein n=1 Tax=Flavobacterium sp. TAB 87 TaxID=1729581 RepID=UPI00076CC008|nr:hypothetical protein [Flavobacterium sp. TAB 87]KVV16364.1 hypothetical protein AP058_00116 [Flavobacterium sp. TAB 87]